LIVSWLFGVLCLAADVDAAETEASVPVSLSVAPAVGGQAPAYYPPVYYPPAYAPVVVPAAPPVTTPTEPWSRSRYLDAHLGLGWLWDSFMDSTRNGPAVPMALSAGLELVPDLVLFGEFSNVHMFSPNHADENLDSVDVYGFGPGLKRYVTPSRFFVSASLSLSWVDHHSDGYDSERLTHAALMGRVSLGKEWWWSPSWGLGIGGQLVLGRVRPEPSPTYSAASASLQVSLTHNLDPNEKAFLALASSRSTAGGFQSHRLYLDARAGLGRLWVNVGNYLMRGWGYPITLSGGLALTRDLVLMGELHDVQVSGVGSSYGTLSSLELYGVGPGVKYYLTPKGFFISGAVSLSRVRYEGTGSFASGWDSKRTSGWGTAARFSVGQELPISPRWSLGVSAEALLGWMGMDEGAYLSREGSSYVPKGLSLLTIASFHDADDSAARGPLPPGAESHEGLYINASLGVGWLHTESHGKNGGELVVSGRGTPLALSIGYVFAKNLVLSWDYCYLHVGHPSLGDDYSSVGIVNLGWEGTGPGARLYLPLNTFVGGSLLLSKVRINNGNPDDSRYGLRWDSEYGITGRVSLGKEFWATDNWGLGLVGEALFGRLPGHDNWPTFSTRGFSLMASSTFN
jgi:hypothetical protein